MWSRLTQEERGSISPVWVSMVVVVLILATAILEREWVNYKLKLAEQTADLAAEAGAHVHEASLSISVNRYQYWYTSEAYCTEMDAKWICKHWDYRDVFHSRSDTVQVSGREKDLRQNWRGLANCGASVYAPDWMCVGTPTITGRSVTFADDAPQAVQQTFHANWIDHHAAAVPNVQVVCDGASRKVTVRVDLVLRPLFGLGVWEVTVPVHGAAVVKLSPLVFG